MATDVQWRGLTDALATRFSYLEIADAWGDGLEVDVKLGDEPINVIALAKGLQEELRAIEFEMRLDSTDLSKLRIVCYPGLGSEDQDDSDQSEERSLSDSGWGAAPAFYKQPFILAPAQGHAVFVEEGNFDALGIAVDCRARAISGARDAIPRLLEHPSIDVAFSGVALSGGKNEVQLSVELLEELKDKTTPAFAALDEGKHTEADDTIELLTGNLKNITDYGQPTDNVFKSMLKHSRAVSGARREFDFNRVIEEALSLAYNVPFAGNHSFDSTLDQDYAETLKLIELAPQEMTPFLLDLFGDGFHASTVRARENSDDAFGRVFPAVTRDDGDANWVRVIENCIYIPPLTNGQAVPAALYDEVDGRGDVVEPSDQLPHHPPTSRRHNSPLVHWFHKGGTQPAGLGFRCGLQEDLRADGLCDVVGFAADTTGRLGLRLFFLMLVLSAAWPWISAPANPAHGLVDVLPQLVVVLAAVVVFLRPNRVAAWYLIPLALGAFATGLK